MNKLANHYSIPDSTIDLFLDLGHSQVGIVAKFEIAEMYNVHSDEIDQIIEAELGHSPEIKVWRSV